MTPGAGTEDPLRIDLLDSIAEVQDAADLWRDIWGGEAWPVQAGLLRANVHAGNYASGAWLGDRMVGASMGFLADPDDPVLHSHITGVVADAAGRGVGRALKLHQAAWCRDHGIDRVAWTYDPLVARNAWFNLSRLGVTVEEYLVDFYGDMPDERNRGQGSDRLHVTWDVAAIDPAADPPGGSPETVAEAVDLLVVEDDEPVVPAGAPGDPAIDAAPALAVGLPADIEALRTRDPALAARWRHAVRDAMAERLGTATAPGPWRIAAFTGERRYLLVRRAD